MKNERRVEIPYEEISLEEAVWRLKVHEGEGWFDADKQMVVMIE